MKIVLKHLAGSISGRTDTFDAAQEIVVGRDEICTIKYDVDRDDLVSRQHLKLVPSGSCPSGYSIVDLQSRNGTFVNRQRISAPTCLQHLDVVQLGAGGPEFRVEYDPPPPPTSRPTRLASGNEVSAARLTRESSLPTITPPARPVGRLTVERMLGENFRKVKGESNKAIYVGIAGIAVALGIGGGLYLYLQHNSEESALRAKQQQGLLQKMDEQVKAQPAQEAQMQAQIMQLGQQLKAAQVENRKELSQLAQNANPTPPPVGTQSAGQPSPSAAAYDQQLQVALQQFQNNDLAASMKSCAGLIKLDGNRWEAYALAGRALSGANKQAEAKNYFVKAEQLAPADTKPQIHQMLDQLGQAPS